MKIVIVGIGEVGYERARSLVNKKGNELALIDRDSDRCDELAEQLDALVLCGDGSDPEMLKKGQIEESDALVASTGLESINTVIAMLGSMMGVEKIIVRLVSVALEPACRQIGVTSIVTPTVSAAAEMISTLYGFHRVNFSSVASGGLELEMLRLSEDRHIKVSELDIPDGSNLVAVMRGDQMLLPRPNLRLEGGEELMLLVEDRRVVEPLRRQLDSED